MPIRHPAKRGHTHAASAEVNNLSAAVTWALVNRVRTDINTATPPTNESVTGFFEIRDNEDVDSLSQYGFTNGTNQLFLRNKMRNGDLVLTRTDSSGVVRTILEGGSSTLLNSPGNLSLRVGHTKTGITCINNGEVKLYHNNVLKAETTATGFEAKGYTSPSGFPTVSSNAVTCDYAVGAAFQVNLDPATGDVTVTVSNGPVSGQLGKMTIKIQQDSTADRTLTWAGATFRWVGGTEIEPQTGSDAITVYELYTWDAGGTWDIRGTYYS